MKTLLLTILAVTLAGCASTRSAEKYAAELRGVLTSYQKQVAAKAKAEQQSYEHLGPIYDNVETTQKLQTLSQERLERAAALTDQIVELQKANQRVTASALRTMLFDYATLDFSTTRDMLAREMNAASQRLAALEALSGQIQQAQTLDSALADLAKPKGKLADAKDLAGFVKTAKNCLDQKRCAALKNELDEAQAQLKTAASDSDKQRLNTKIKQLQDEQTKNCTPPPTCGAGS